MLTRLLRPSSFVRSVQGLQTQNSLRLASSLTNSLHHAASVGDLESVEQYLQDGADINARDEQRWTPIELSVIFKRESVFKSLINHGADTDRMTSRGHALRDLALFYNNSSAAQLIPMGEQKASTNFFSNSTIQRQSKLRTDENWIQEKMTDNKTRYVLMNRNEIAVIPTNKRHLTLLNVNYEMIEKYLRANNRNFVFLGEQDKQCIFAVHLEKLVLAEIVKLHQEARVIHAFPGALKLRQDEASLYSHAVGMLSWQRSQRFCSVCGNATVIKDAGYKLTCSNHKCSTHKGAVSASYPRVDPTIISAVISPDQSRTVLARQPRFPPGMYSCIAGFVEPGESVEACCVREVEEEVGLRVHDVSYLSSQFWPMPASLMLGCLATADGELSVDSAELEDARWFTREEVVDMMCGRHAGGLFVPPVQAIAHQLLQTWVLRTATI